MIGGVGIGSSASLTGECTLLGFMVAVLFLRRKKPRTW